MLLVGNRNHQMGPAAVQPVMNQDSLFLPLLEVSKMRTLTWADSWKRSALPATTANLTHLAIFLCSKPNVPTSMCASLKALLISVLERIRWQLQPTRGDVAMAIGARWRLVDSLTRCFDFDTLTAWIRTAHDSRIVGPPENTNSFFWQKWTTRRLGDSPPEDQLRLLKFGTMKF